MTEAREFTFQDYLGIASRRKWLIVGCILLSLTIALALCLILPRSYISSTLIIVESQKVPEDYVKGVVTFYTMYHQHPVGPRDDSTDAQKSDTAHPGHRDVQPL